MGSSAQWSDSPVSSLFLPPSTRASRAPIPLSFVCVCCPALSPLPQAQQRPQGTRSLGWAAEMPRRQAVVRQTRRQGRREGKGREGQGRARACLLVRLAPRAVPALFPSPARSEQRNTRLFPSRQLLESQWPGTSARLTGTPDNYGEMGGGSQKRKEGKEAKCLGADCG
jgi:hypothetical protein